MAEVRLPTRAKGAQAECNAPVTGVKIVVEKGRIAQGVDAGTAAAAPAAKASHRAKLEATAQANFRRQMVRRLKSAGAAQRAEATKAKRASTAQAAAAGYGILQHKPWQQPYAEPAADVLDEFEMVDEADVPPVAPVQLANVRMGLAHHAVKAREIMLTHSEMPSTWASSAQPPPPPLPQDPQYAPPAYYSHAPEPAAPPARKLVAPASGPSMLRAVVTSAAQADRLQAREAREAREAEAKQARQRERVATAVKNERAVAERAQALQLQVEKLEHEAARAERIAEKAIQYRSAHLKAQKQLETERYIDARRDQLRKEVSSRGRPLTPLCCCGIDPLDNHTANCARNCIFYNNPAAYARALSGLFVRPILLD